MSSGSSRYLAGEHGCNATVLLQSGNQASYGVLLGGLTCSIKSLFHSPSATRMALASKTKASIRLCDR